MYVNGPASQVTVVDDDAFVMPNVVLLLLGSWLASPA